MSWLDPHNGMTPALLVGDIVISLPANSLFRRNDVCAVIKSSSSIGLSAADLPPLLLCGGERVTLLTPTTQEK